MKKTLALIFGGEGAERRISEIGAYETVQKNKDAFSILTIGIDSAGDWYIYSGIAEKIKDGSWRQDEKELTPTFPVKLFGKSGFYKDGYVVESDAVFPLLHGDRGEDGTVQGALKCAHIPYIGSDVIPSAITADKAYTKMIAEYLGIPTLPWFVPASTNMRSVRQEAELRLSYPMFIKPRRLGSSIGASPVMCRNEFFAAYEKAARLSGGIMIEQMAEVKAELEFAHFDGSQRFISREGVIHSHGNFYDFNAKYNGEGSPKTEVGGTIDKNISRTARRYSRLLADFLELGNLSRIDFFLTPSGELYFNEINSVPGMTADSLYSKLAELHGRLDSPFIEDIILSGKRVW